MGDPTPSPCPAFASVAGTSDAFAVPLPVSPMRWAPTRGVSRFSRASAGYRPSASGRRSSPRSRSDSQYDCARLAVSASLSMRRLIARPCSAISAR